MADLSPAAPAPYGELAPDTDDVPVNPYSLLEAVNDASAAARNGWALFLGIMTYVLIAVAGVTHRDLLLNSRVELPILQVEIEMTRFFVFAPIVLLFFHYGVLIQHVMLARKVIEFDDAVRPLETGPKRNHPLRLELHSYFFTIALAGPERSSIFGGFLHAMIWISFVTMPVVLLLYIQVTFIPYHDVDTTWVHRITLVASVIVLALIGVFLRRTEPSFIGALFNIARRSPTAFVVTGTLITAVLLFSFLVATVPGEALDRFSRDLPRHASSSSDAARAQSANPADGIAEYIFGDGGVLDLGQFSALFNRNLVVSDQDLVSDAADNADSNEASIILRGRDLRYAQLNRTDLHRADLTGADLTGASLVGADLRDIKASCSDLSAVLTLGQSRSESCTVLTGVKMSRADVSGADFQGSFLAGASLDEANIDNANFSYAELTGVDFSAARMRRVALTGGADIVGANFLGASLQGADFTGAKLQMADFSGATLQGALFGFAQLQGTTFQGAEMNGANLTATRLHGADFSGAILEAADLSTSKIWLSVPPAPDDTRLMDTSSLKIDPPGAGDLAVLEAATQSLPEGRLKQSLVELLYALRAPKAQEWANSTDAERWRDYQVINGGTQNAANLSRNLVSLGCQVRWSDGAVASGLAQRALTRAFKGNVDTIYRGFRSERCSASGTIGTPLLMALATLVEQRLLENQAQAASTAESE